MFQSLFSWSYLSKDAVEAKIHGVDKFQSLFSWSYLSKIVVIVFFISENTSFQSLFSWSYLSKTSWTTSRNNWVLVSILIFLELPFKEQPRQSWIAFQVSFNPYFPGVTFQSIHIAILCITLFEFQSLFSWSYLSKLYFFWPIRKCFGVSILIFLELPFKEQPPYLRQIIRLEFQSLFSWSYLSKTVLINQPQNHHHVSILIFLELPFKDSQFSIQNWAVGCFNPYFPGVTFQRVPPDLYWL